ncbi:thiamine-phosphate kinase [Tumebacillus flagellatus]|uniref:thiamine-phosphate kinase n=1 Tax=Tumebacillus flagellatus TaxID=1157490 RepID=UPI001930CE37|nr:thiamine-phosphate kinase [Tumebacillus flagellatus]
MKIREIGEFGLIDAITGLLDQGDDSVVVGIGDDAAVTAYSKGSQVVTTTDMLVEGVHFRRDTISDRSLGYKSLAVSISDIAAMGGIPKHAVISLAIPVEMEVERLQDLYAGVADVCRDYQTHVVGGDIVKTSGPFVISVTLIGEVEAGRALLRSGARPGDLLFVTGTVGGSAAGLDCLLQAEPRVEAAEEDLRHLLQAHQEPRPQVSAGRLLLESGFCTSLNDVSDGLASECNEIAEKSGVRLVLEGESVPLHESVRRYAASRGQDPLEWALFGGEDYQLVGTMKPEGVAPLTALFAKNALSITVIGRVDEAGTPGVTLVRNAQKQELKPRGFNHFG